MKKFILAVLVTLNFAACNDTNEVPENEPLNLLPKTISITAFNDASFLNKIKKHHSGRLAQEADFNNSQLVTFEGTNIKGVVTPINGDSQKSLFNYINESNELYQEQFINEISSDKGIPKSSYFDLDGNLIFYLTIEGSDIKIYKGGKDSSNAKMLRETGWLSTTAECVGAVAGQMTDGSVVGSASFLGCMAWGFGCAVAIGVSCGIMGYALM